MNNKDDEIFDLVEKTINFKNHLKGYTEASTFPYSGHEIVQYYGTGGTDRRKVYVILKNGRYLVYPQTWTTDVNEAYKFFTYEAATIQITAERSRQ